MRSHIFALAAVIVLITCGRLYSQLPKGNPPPKADTAKADQAKSTTTAEISDDLKKLFAQLDDLGRAPVKDAKRIELTLVNVQEPERRQTKQAWQLSETDQSITVFEDDLTPWTYSKADPTTIPASWNPAKVKLESSHEADAAAWFKKLSETGNKESQRRLFAPGPSYRALAAHAAWKKGMPQYCNSIIAPDLEGKAFQEYQQAVFDDLAWLQFLRSVNLLMYADRADVVKQLRLVPKISPKSEFVEQSKDLADRLEKIIAQKAGKPAAPADESKLTDDQRAGLYVSQLVDLRCPQFSQPGDIVFYVGIADDKPVQDPPTSRLRQMDMAAVPALLKALEDDTPTRTVYHWRDFHHSRQVWRVSDFAWHLLRDISRREFGNRPAVGFTFTSMPPAERKQVIEEVKQWYAGGKALSADDRMLALFDSHNPEDWKTAAAYFVQNKDKRALAPLLKRISEAGQFDSGKLCELAAGLGDPSAIPTIQKVMKSAPQASDRMSAAIALWDLGDKSGVPLAIEFAKAKDQAYGHWEEPIWFLMKSKTPEGIDALRSIVGKAPASRVGEVIETIASSVSGDLWGQRREAVGCLEVCPILIFAMDRNEDTGATVNDVKVRIKDSAARAMVLLREGSGDMPGRFASVDPKLFNQDEPDEKKRDLQIDALKAWYEANKEQLTWDARSHKLAVRGR